VLTLLFLLHLENGDVSFLVKYILNTLRSGVADYVILLTALHDTIFQ
jgi:hypothetical protein